MTWHFNINNKEYVTVNHVIFNPTFKCNVGCPGCYLTAFARKSKPESANSNEWMSNWVRDCLTENGVLCNQVSISINTNDKDTMADNKTRFLLRHIGSIKDRTDTDLAVSIAGKDIFKYLDEITFAGANIVSLSVDSYKYIPNSHGKYNACMDMFDHIAFVKTFYKDRGLPEPILNINMLVNKDFKVDVLNQLIQNDSVDHIYLIMEKPTLGKAYYNSLEHKQKSIWYRSYQTMEILVNNHEKVTFDSCFIDARTKVACSEGLNLMSVWPNKSLTGCPYAGGERGKVIPNDIQGFADVIRYYRMIRRTDRDWDRCKIPEIEDVKYIRRQRALSTRS